MTISHFSLDDPINETFPHLTKRPISFTYLNSDLIQLATFLAIGPQIYIDGLVVVLENQIQKQKQVEQNGIAGRAEQQITIQTVLGRIGSKHILQCIINPNSYEPVRYYPESLYVRKASEIMEKITENLIIELDSPLRDVLDVFKKTRFAFIPIVETIDNNNTKYHKAVASITVRDFLKLFTGLKKYENTKDASNSIADIDIERIKKMPAKDIASNLISVNEDDVLQNVLYVMFSKNIRNLGVMDKKSRVVGIINDRNILEFLISPATRMLVENNRDSIGTLQTRKKIDDDIIAQKKIKQNLNLSDISEVKDDTTVSQAAQLLLDPRNPYLILENRNKIVTPWDIVMKTLSF
ncbi:MAG TPA: CBS domain-containing protein [Nitrososphaeraceae archaeon]|nr:CBS domain-containing protein [Nitrososphaeraceae archaeon]